MDNETLADLRARLAARGVFPSDSVTTTSPYDDALADLRMRLAARQNAAPVAPAAIQAKTFEAAPNPPALWDTFKNGVAKGAAGFGDMAGNAVVNAANIGIMGYGLVKHKLTGSNDLPDTIDPTIASGYSKLGHALGLINDQYDPVTMPGRIVDAIGQVTGAGGVNPKSLTNSVTPIMKGIATPWAKGAVTALYNNAGSISRQVATPVISGVGSGVGSELTRGVDTGSPLLDSIIKTGAAVGGGFIGAPLAARGTAGDRAAAAMNGVTDDQIAQANTLLQKSADAGSPITGYEAIQAVTGANPKMQVQQRLAEQSDAAAKKLTTMMQSRPANNAALMDRVTANIPTSSAPPDTLAGTLQVAANDSITAARQAGNANAAPYYATTSNDPSVKIPPADWNNLVSNPGVAHALNFVKNDPYSGLANATEGSVQWLDSAKRYLDSQSEAASSAMNPDRFRAGNMSSAASDITNTVDPVLPDYAKARGIVAKNMNDVVVPMENGQIGKLAGSNDFKQQSESLLPNAPADVNPTVLQNTAQTINAQNPDILSQFLAQDLKRKFAEATQQNIGGENTMGGAKFAANVSGNPMQRENLMSMLAGSGADPAEFGDALDIYKAQGYKPAANSATSANLTEGSQSRSLFTPVVTAKNIWDGWVNGAATTDLSNALAAKENSINQLRDLARTSTTVTPMQSAVLSTLLTAPNVAIPPEDQNRVIVTGLPNSQQQGIISGAMNAAN